MPAQYVSLGLVVHGVFPLPALAASTKSRNNLRQRYSKSFIRTKIVAVFVMREGREACYIILKATLKAEFVDEDIAAMSTSGGVIGETNVAVNVPLNRRNVSVELNIAPR
jgi:hypothetical protein